MTTILDQHAINHATVALRRAMTPAGRNRHPDGDVIFLGGPAPSEADEDELGQFGLRKNYKIVFATFDPAAAAAGPTAFHAVVTDGLTQSIVLSGGQLWKRDRRSAAVLLFPGTRAAVRVTSKGRLAVSEMKERYHDHGYDLAREAVLAAAARKPGRGAVIAPIGRLTTVLDMKTFAETFDNAD